MWGETVVMKAADLFCGAGGSSTGLTQACDARGVRLDLTAVNHWPRAVETHSANHPKARHLCETLEQVDPRKLYPRGRLDILIASPECTHHSVARGGKPMSDQSRATAWHVVRWADAIRPRAIIVENVREFQTWGPLGENGRPLKRRRGEVYRAWTQALEALGYRVEARVLNAADYGDATTRERLFVVAVRGRGPVPWPTPTHSRAGGRTLFGDLPRWRPARDIIDWSLPCPSIFNRKRPLSANTLRRIEAGLRKFGEAAAEPFLALLRGTAPDQTSTSVRGIDEPVPTISASGEHCGLVMTMSQTGSNGSRCRRDGEPLPTVTTADDLAFITTMNYTKSAEHDGRYTPGLDVPLPTITSQGNRFGVIIPTNYGERPGQSPRCHDAESPLPTIVGANTHGVVQPFVIHTTHHGERRQHGTGEPLPTVTGANRGELAFILPHRQFDGMQTDDPERPLRTITGTNGGCNAVCQPFIVPYYGTGVADAVGDPTATITAKDRLGLVSPDGVRLDIGFRMLQPHELAAAMSFPAGYHFAGNRSEKVRQIGNAVAVGVARALCGAVLDAVA